jgi:acyl carrier protein
MPLTRNGKIDRGALPDPERLRAGNRRERLVPRTPVEQTLHGIWSQVLRSDQIGVDENFFELGGHSLMAAQIVSRMREAFQLEIPLRSLFDAVTIEQQAAVVEQARQNGDGLQSPAIVRVSRQQYRASVAVEKESHRRRV